jgi:hypothetical protein
MLIVEFHSGASAEADEANYKASECSLVYRHRPEVHVHASCLADRIDETLGIRHDADFLVIADTLVIVFSRKSRELLGFDAYTNQERWRRSSDIALPDISGVGKVCLVDSLPEGRLDLCVIPRYAYSDAQRLLEISLNRVPEGAEYYRVSNRLVVGVHGGMIISLLVQGLRIVS